MQTLPHTFAALPAVAFAVDDALLVTELAGGTALAGSVDLAEGTDLGIQHAQLAPVLREAIGGRTVRRRVVLNGVPLLLDARPQDGGALVVLLALDGDRQAAVALTDRQLEILHLLCLGLPSREIGRRLWIAETTVENHLRGIYRRLRCTTRAEAVSRAFRLGLVDAAVLDAVDQPA
ncbi:MAG: helix-turn-helix domain-containing protein [Gaiellales bacterium]